MGAAHLRTAHPELDPTSHDRGVFARYLQRARMKLGVSNKELAFYWSVDHGFASMLLNNLKPLPAHRITQLQKPLRIAVLEEWAFDEGVPIGKEAALAQALVAIAHLAPDESGLTLRPDEATLVRKIRELEARSPRALAAIALIVDQVFAAFGPEPVELPFTFEARL